MHCVNHPEITAEERCHYCKHPVCADCAKEDRGLLVCPRCYESLNAPADALDESSPRVAADWALRLSVAGLVFFGLGLFFIGLFSILSLGLVVAAMFVARDVKRHLKTPHTTKEAKLANAALWISMPLIVWMGLYMIYVIFYGGLAMYASGVD